MSANHSKYIDKQEHRCNRNRPICRILAAAAEQSDHTEYSCLFEFHKALNRQPGLIFMIVSAQIFL